jgi:hypothetical protein
LHGTVHFAALHLLVHQADGQGLRRIEPPAGHGQALGLRVAQALDQERCNLCGHHAQRSFGQTKAGGFGGDGYIGHAGQAKATAHHRALQHCHHRQRGVGKRGAQVAKFGVHMGNGIGSVALVLQGAHAGSRHVLEVAPRAEMPTGTAQHHHADGIRRTDRAFGLCQGAPQLTHHGKRHGVAHLGAIQGNFEHSARS